MILNECGTAIQKLTQICKGSGKENLQSLRCQKMYFSLNLLVLKYKQVQLHVFTGYQQIYVFHVHHRPEILC